MRTARVIGIVVMVVGLGFFAWGLDNVLTIGTCASGGPFEIARPCPEGAGGYVAALAAGSVAAIVGGIVGAPFLATPIIFTVIGVTSIQNGVRDTGSDQTFAYAFGGGFLAFGLVMLVGAIALRRSFGSWRRSVSVEGLRTAARLVQSRAAPTSAPQGPSPPASPPPPEEQPAPLRILGELERLAALRRSGAITDAEYAKLKTEILTRG